MAHALLSPSAAHRWMHCTASPLLEREVEDKATTYAEEGTLAHAYCAKKLKEFLKRDTSSEDGEIAMLSGKYHTGEMDEYTDTYMTIVLGKYATAQTKTQDAQLLVEQHLDFTKWVPSGFGTGDAIIIADGCMEIIDFKYGKGVKVSAVENPQMMIYALGAYDAFNFEYDIKKIRMTIVQPRIDNLSEFEITADELLTWAEKELLPKAEEAYSGNGKQCAGDWCKFCKVKGNCKALATKCMESYKAAADPRLLTPEEIAEKVLPQLPIIKSWLADAEAYALDQALKGVAFPHYKIVEGRSIRKITDPQGVIDTLSDQGFKAADFIKPTELRSITDLEKLVGKKAFGTLCADYITKPQGKPTLVPESDKRSAMNAAEEDFKNIQ